MGVRVVFEFKPAFLGFLKYYPAWVFASLVKLVDCLLDRFEKQMGKSRVDLWGEGGLGRNPVDIQFQACKLAYEKGVGRLFDDEDVNLNS